MTPKEQQLLDCTAVFLRPTLNDLLTERDRLRVEVDRLRAENARLAVIVAQRRDDADQRYSARVDGLEAG